MVAHIDDPIAHVPDAARPAPVPVPAVYKAAGVCDGRPVRHPRYEAQIKRRQNGQLTPPSRVVVTALTVAGAGQSG